MLYRESVGVPADHVKVNVKGVDLAVSREGQGPPVVCLHAIGHGGGDFEQFASAVKKRFEVIRIDWPGQGRSGVDPASTCPSHYADLLKGVISTLRISAPIIIGNSIGGATAILYAQKHVARGIVLCDSGGLVPVSFVTRTWCGAIARFFAAGERRARWFMPLFRAYYRRLVLPSEAAAPQRERIIASGYEIAPILRQAWESFASPEADIRHVAAALDIPVWIAWAKKDRVIPLSLCMPCIRKMKQAYVTRFDGGHVAFLERPDEFVRGFFQFVQTLEETPEARRAL